jgi:hypothetical protein
MAILGERDFADIAKYTSTYTTFSGADISCNFNGTTVGTLSGITWSVTREKAPVYTMGSPNPRSFSRGKRGIAGSLIFTTFDRPALYNLIRDGINKDELKIWTREWNLMPNMNSTVATNIASVESSLSGVRSVAPYYADQVLPFDVTITYLNEYGQAAVKSVYGVELLNEGSGASMDDIVIEETMTFIAREVGPMIPTNREFVEAEITLDQSAVTGFGLG